MRRTRIEFLLVGLTVLALSAGVVAGMLASRLPAGGTSTETPPPSPMALSDELQLTPDQREQMRQIWEPVRSQVHARFTEADDLQRQRDQALVALLNDEQKAKFEKISKQFADKFAAINESREKTFQSAVDRTLAILDETQRAKYQSIIRDRFPHLPTTQTGGPPPPPPPAQ
jgi:Spy/CpxP family protein refolding chaperone